MNNKRTASVDWESIKIVIAAGMEINEAAEKFGVSHWTIRKRIEREKWITPKNLEDRVYEITGSKKPDIVQQVDENPMIEESLVEISRPTQALAKVSPLDAVAESWAEKGEMHRRTAFEIAAKAVKKAKVAPPKNWKDLEIADKMARRAAGLKDDQTAAVVNFGVFGGGSGNQASGYSEAED